MIILLNICIFVGGNPRSYNIRFNRDVYKYRCNITTFMQEDERFVEEYPLGFFYTYFIKFF